MKFRKGRGKDKKRRRRRKKTSKKVVGVIGGSAVISLGLLGLKKLGDANTKNYKGVKSVTVYSPNEASESAAKNFPTAGSLMSSNPTPRRKGKFVKKIRLDTEKANVFRGLNLKNERIVSRRKRKK